MTFKLEIDKIQWIKSADKLQFDDKKHKNELLAHTRTSIRAIH